MPVLQLQQIALPRDEQRLSLALIRRHRVERAARCDQRRLQPMRNRHRVPAPAQFFRSPLHLPRRPGSPAFCPDRPFRFGQPQTALRRLAKTLPASRRKMPVIGNFTGDKFFGSPNEEMILQDVESGSIRSLRFLVAPLPQFAQDRTGAAAELAGPGDSPWFVVIARALDGRLLERPLARLPEPIEPAALAQP